jgi:pyruvate dehydrogenase E2 component (dihydrolipoamide acetyltransferase)
VITEVKGIFQENKRNNNMQEFKLPDLGEGMHEAEIRRWLVKAGDTVKLDQPMLEVETDKAVVEIPAPFAGRVAEIRVPEGKVAQLGTVLVTFDTGTGTSTATATAPIVAGAVASVQAPTNAAVASGAATHSRVLAAPAVRKRAFELGIALEQVPPSHPSGRVTMEDVEAYAQRATASTPVAATTPSAPPTPSVAASSNGSSSAVIAEHKGVPATPATAVEERQALTGLRRRIAERMEHAWRTIPHAVAFGEVDGTELVALRQALKPVAQQRGVRLTYMPLLIKLLLPVLKEFPIFNASFDEEKREIVYKRFYHIGIAADAPEGLLVPVIRDADKLTGMEIAQRLEHLIEGAQKRTLTLQEVTGSTFTLNNIGAFGGSSGVPIINAPEAAILAVGRLQEKPVIVNGAITARPIMPLTLSFDHRLIDGGMSGKFMERFKELVEHPQQLWLDMI